MKIKIRTDIFSKRNSNTILWRATVETFLRPPPKKKLFPQVFYANMWFVISYKFPVGIYAENREIALDQKKFKPGLGYNEDTYVYKWYWYIVYERVIIMYI